MSRRDAALELSQWLGENPGPAITVTGLRFSGQPVWRVWCDGATRVLWYSRKIKRLKDGSWTVARYAKLQEVSIDRRERPDARMVKLRAAEAKLTDVPGVRVTKEHLQELRERLGQPQPGQVVTDEHGRMRCLCCCEGYVMWRRPGCFPGVMAEEKWLRLLQAEPVTVDHPGKAY